MIAWLFGVVTGAGAVLFWWLVHDWARENREHADWWAAQEHELHLPRDCR